MGRNHIRFWVTTEITVLSTQKGCLLNGTLSTPSPLPTVPNFPFSLPFHFISCCPITTFFFSSPSLFYHPSIHPLACSPPLIPVIFPPTLFFFWEKYNVLPFSSSIWLEPGILLMGSSENENWINPTHFIESLVPCNLLTCKLQHNIWLIMVCSFFFFQKLNLDYKIEIYGQEVNQALWDQVWVS